jgi:hypothetical protein
LGRGSNEFFGAGRVEARTCGKGIDQLEALAESRGEISAII